MIRASSFSAQQLSNALTTPHSIDSYITLPSLTQIQSIRIDLEIAHLKFYPYHPHIHVHINTFHNPHSWWLKVQSEKVMITFYSESQVREKLPEK